MAADINIQIEFRRVFFILDLAGIYVNLNIGNFLTYIYIEFMGVIFMISMHSLRFYIFFIGFFAIGINAHVFGMLRSQDEVLNHERDTSDSDDEPQKKRLKVSLVESEEKDVGTLFILNADRKEGVLFSDLLLIRSCIEQANTYCLCTQYHLEGLLESIANTASSLMRDLHEEVHTLWLPNIVLHHLEGTQYFIITAKHIENNLKFINTKIWTNENGDLSEWIGHQSVKVNSNFTCVMSSVLNGIKKGVIDGRQDSLIDKAIAGFRTLNRFFTLSLNTQEVVEDNRDWNIYISGHGSLSENVICCVEVQDFIAFLKKCSEVNTRLIAVMSCFSGGINRKYIEESFQGFSRTFPILLFSSGDMLANPTEPFLQELTSCLGSGSMDQEWADTIYQKLTFASASKFAMLDKIPLILWPHNNKFEPLSNTEVGLLLDNAEEANSSVIEDKRVVFVKPTRVSYPLVVKPITITVSGSISNNSSDCSFYNFVSLMRTFVLQMNDKKDYDILKPFRDNTIYHEYLITFPTMSDFKQSAISTLNNGIANYSFDMPTYPKFYTFAQSKNPKMIHRVDSIGEPKKWCGDAKCLCHLSPGIHHSFQQIITQDEQLGVFAFMRDAFFDCQSNSAVSYLYHIDRLCGVNDLKHILAQKEFNILEESYDWTDKINDDVVELEDVLIEIGDELAMDYESHPIIKTTVKYFDFSLKVSFRCNGRYWQLNYVGDSSTPFVKGWSALKAIDENEYTTYRKNICERWSAALDRS